MATIRRRLVSRSAQADTRTDSSVHQNITQVGPARSQFRVVERTDGIYLIEYNDLAGAYLSGLLKPSYAVQIIRPCNDNQVAPQSHSNSLVLIDAESLPLRLSDCVHWVSSRLRGAKILVVGTEPPVDDLCELIWIGIQGFVSTDRISEINSAIESLRAGRLWIRQEILEKFACYSSALARSLKRRPHSLITPQERRIVGLLRKKYSNKEIAVALDITERTVKFHLANIFNKLGVHDRSSALELLVRTNLVNFREAGGGSTPRETDAVHDDDVRRAGT
jgi:DNA-binding NarL/FixJ family response regulator